MRRGGATIKPRTRPSPTPAPRLEPLAERIARDFPAASHAILLAGIARLADYQDDAYASEYLDRLAPIRMNVRSAAICLMRETGALPGTVDVL